MVTYDTLSHFDDQCLHFVSPCLATPLSDDVARWSGRGSLVLRTGREPAASLSQNQLSESDRTRLKVNI